jgi:hypothetical protein
MGMDAWVGGCGGWSVFSVATTDPALINSGGGLKFLPYKIFSVGSGQVAVLATLNPSATTRYAVTGSPSLVVNASLGAVVRATVANIRAAAPNVNAIVWLTSDTIDTAAQVRVCVCVCVSVCLCVCMYLCACACACVVFVCAIETK